ncbi:MAG: excisionase family DNA-binding protein [Acidobacteria bacterium]|nr:excisionase family DNA-binding protein [Acidobacteriota bacterium]
MQTSNTDGKVFISVKEAAGRMSVSERSVREALRSGRLKAGRFGRRVLLRWRDVEELIEGPEGDTNEDRSDAA